MTNISDILSERIPNFSDILSRLISDMILIMLITIIIVTCCKLFYPEIEAYFKNKAKKMAMISTDPNVLHNIAENYENDYEIISRVLKNKNAPTELLDEWLLEKSWRYGLKPESFYGGTIEVNQRERLMRNCVSNPNISGNAIQQVALDILNNDKKYFIEVCYPEDDYDLIKELNRHEN